jgi:hypothetical protein
MSTNLGLLTHQQFVQASFILLNNEALFNQLIICDAESKRQ